MKIQGKKFIGAIAVVAVMLGISAPVRAQSVRLKATATVEAGVVRVGDVATIDGVDADLAEKFVRTPILTATTSVTIRAEQVLCAIITENGSSAITSKLEVNGPVECAVSIAGVAPAQVDQETSSNRAVATIAVTPPAEQSVATAAPLPAAGTVPADNAGRTLADLITDGVVEQLGVTRQDVRITFDTVNPLLDEPAPAGAHWNYRPVGHNIVGSTQWEAQLVDGSHQRHLLVQATVLQRTSVVVAVDTIRPGDVISAAQVRAQEHWIDRKLSTLFSKPQDVIGQIALPAHGIAAGTMLDQRDFKPVAMAATGELVTVYMISGGLTVKQQATAVSSGRLHESILLRSQGSGKTGEEYQATLIGHDVAVVGDPLDPVTEAKLKEQR